MKKTSLGFVTAFFCIVLTVCRIPLKLFNINLLTGFYSRENMMGVAFNLLFFLLLGLTFFVAYKNKEDFECSIRVGTVRTVIFTLSSIAIVAVSFLRFKETMGMDLSYENAVPPILVYPAHILGMVSGILLLFLSLSLFSGATMKRPPHLLSLFLPVWCSLLSLADFLNFRFTIYSSDEMMYTLFMLASTLFFLYLSKSLIMPEDKNYIYAAACTCVCGFPLAISQIVALSLLERGIAGPTILQCTSILAVSLIAFCFIIIPAKKRNEN